MRNALAWINKGDVILGIGNLSIHHIWNEDSHDLHFFIWEDELTLSALNLIEIRFFLEMISKKGQDIQRSYLSLNFCDTRRNVWKCIKKFNDFFALKDIPLVFFHNSKIVRLEEKSIDHVNQENNPSILNWIEIFGKKIEVSEDWKKMTFISDDLTISFSWAEMGIVSILLEKDDWCLLSELAESSGRTEGTLKVHLSNIRRKLKDIGLTINKDVYKIIEIEDIASSSKAVVKQINYIVNPTFEKLSSWWIVEIQWRQLRIMDESLCFTYQGNDFRMQRFSTTDLHILSVLIESFWQNFSKGNFKRDYSCTAKELWGIISRFNNFFDIHDIGLVIAHNRQDICLAAWDLTHLSENKKQEFIKIGNIIRFEWNTLISSEKSLTLTAYESEVFSKLLITIPFNSKLMIDGSYLKTEFNNIVSPFEFSSFRRKLASLDFIIVSSSLNDPKLHINLKWSSEEDMKNKKRDWWLQRWECIFSEKYFLFQKRDRSFELDNGKIYINWNLVTTLAWEDIRITTYFLSNVWKLISQKDVNNNSSLTGLTQVQRAISRINTTLHKEGLAKIESVEMPNNDSKNQNQAYFKLELK